MNTIFGNCAINTDRELWKETPDYYSPSIHETENGNIGIDVSGNVLVAPVKMWHTAGEMLFTVPFRLDANWKYRIGCSLYLFLLHRVLRPLFDWLGRPGYER